MSKQITLALTRSKKWSYDDDYQIISTSPKVKDPPLGKEILCVGGLTEFLGERSLPQSILLVISTEPINDAAKVVIEIGCIRCLGKLHHWGRWHDQKSATRRTLWVGLAELLIKANFPQNIKTKVWITWRAT